MTPVTVRDARPEDAAAIGRIARASWSDTYRDIFEPAFIDDFLERHYAPASLAEQARSAADRDDVEFLVAERDGEIVAYLHFGPGPHGPQLYRIYADPAHYVPSNITFGIMEPLTRPPRGKMDRKVAMANRALDALAEWMRERAA